LNKGELKPVGPKAQKKVPLPNGLDLEGLIFEQSDDEEEEPDEEVELEDDIDDAFNDYYAENNGNSRHFDSPLIVIKMLQERSRRQKITKSCRSEKCD